MYFLMNNLHVLDGTFARLIPFDVKFDGGYRSMLRKISYQRQSLGRKSILSNSGKVHEIHIHINFEYWRTIQFMNIEYLIRLIFVGSEMSPTIVSDEFFSSFAPHFV